MSAASDEPAEASPAPSAPPLGAAERARGRRLAITSHPFGMTFWHVYQDNLPTLALISLGASELIVGVQSGMSPLLQLLQLPMLRLVSRIAKRRILVAGQALALAGAAPLLLFSSLAAQEQSVGIAMALVALAVVNASLKATNIVWFPLLNSYMEPGRTGRFFGTIRTVWHAALIVYYLGAQYWLAAHPGDYGTLFLAAWVCGALRIALISRMPERSERTGQRIRAREAMALLRENTDLRAYLAGMIWFGAVRTATAPFAIVMLIREVGFGDRQVLMAVAIATYVGGFVSLYAWGRIVDRVGPVPVFVATALASGALVAALAGIGSTDATTLLAVVGIFFGLSVLSAGFGVADTQLLFELAPPEAPTRLLTIAGVTLSTALGLAPIACGFILERGLAGSQAPLGVYSTFFGVAGVVQALSFLPLLRFRRRSLH